jgi:Zn-dependent peptidase ImmA (M78 family)
MTIKQARQILSAQQVLLGLPEWVIVVKWGKNGDMDGVDGRCVWSPEYAHAEITLNRQQPDVEIPRTICHELVHVALQGHAPHTGKYSEMQERGINRIVDAILGGTTTCVL